MRDIKPLKYWIPRLKFNVKPATNQRYKVAYKLKDGDNLGGVWTTISDNYEFDPDGNGVGGKLEITNPQDDAKYIVRFTDIFNKHTYFEFNTGINMGLSDSPYYNKTLFPGQIYDWWQGGLSSLGMPEKDTDAVVFYKANGKKGVSIDIDNWYSLLAMSGDNTVINPVVADIPVNVVEDKFNYTLTGFKINAIGGKATFIALPSHRFDEGANGFVSGRAYYSEDGGGGISAYDICTGATFGFAFHMDENTDGEQTLAFFDNSKTAKLNPTAKYAWRMTISPAGIKTYTTINGVNNTLTDNTPVAYGRWHYIMIREDETYICTMNNKSGEGNGSPTLRKLTALTAIMTPQKSDMMNINNNAVTSLNFGSHDTIGLTVSNIAVGVSHTIVDKILNPDKYLPILRLSGIGDDNQVKWFHDCPKSSTTLVSSARVSFYIPDTIFEDVPFLIPAIGLNNLNVGKIKANIMSGGQSYAEHIFEGFSVPDATNGGTIKYGGLIKNNEYIAENYDIDFTTHPDPVALLGQHYFTKHGTWGGYNGGVNGHNLYFNKDKALVLECHGDQYSGTLKGVAKEGKMTPYTGYGPDVDYHNNSWDQRSNKLTARTGTAIVSNQYYTWGRIDIWMKIPVGCWGVCPAIWFFHYIEVGDTDSRFNKPPYNERNAQGGVADGQYRVVNNEIDIELPSHLTNGTLSDFSQLTNCYFDPNAIDNQLHIGVLNGTPENKGLFRLTNPADPYSRSSWTKVSDAVLTRVQPSFANMKLNNWVGELNSGNGWTVGSSRDAAKDYYTSADMEKEEYLSQLTKVANNDNGYADGEFHKWSIVWLPNTVVLLVDDKYIRENKAFIPFNQMKLTIAGWFPTMRNNAAGCRDTDGIHGVKGAVIAPLTDNPNTSIGTWAGPYANFDVLHLEVSRIKWERYPVGTTVEVNGVKHIIDKEPTSYGESFPESGLRSFVK